MNEQRQGGEAPLQTFVRVLRQRVVLVTLCAVIVPVVAYIASSSQDDEYTATAKLLLTEPAIDPTGALGSVAVTDLDSAATNLDLVSLNAIARRAAAELGTGFSPAEVQESVDVVTRGDSSVIDIRAVSGEPERAAAIGNAYAARYIDFRRERATDQLDEAVAAVDEQLQEAREQKSQGLPHAEISALSDKADELRLESGLQTGNAELVERAIPAGAPSSPKPKQAAALGLGFGLLIGIGFSLLIELISRRLNDAREVEELYDAPILGVIPRTDFLAESRLDASDIPMGERNAFQNVRTSLRYYNDYNVGSALVLSSGPQEGKTTVAWNLSVAAAEAGVRVLLLEADLRAPSIAIRAGIRSEPGLNKILTGEIDVEDAIQRIPVVSPDNGRSPATLDVITAGRPQASPTRLIESERLPRLIMTLEEWYDLVVIDAPPALVVPDAISMINHVGGVIIVSRVRKDTRDAAENLRRALENVGAPVLGAVINAVGPPEGLYDYGYGYEPQPRDVRRAPVSS